MFKISHPRHKRLDLSSSIPNMYKLLYVCTVNKEMQFPSVVTFRIFLMKVRSLVNISNQNKKIIRN